MNIEKTIQLMLDTNPRIYKEIAVEIAMMKQTNTEDSWLHYHGCAIGISRDDYGDGLVYRATAYPSHENLEAYVHIGDYK